MPYIEGMASVNQDTNLDIESNSQAVQIIDKIIDSAKESLYLYQHCSIYLNLCFFNSQLHISFDDKF